MPLSLVVALDPPLPPPVEVAPLSLAVAELPDPSPLCPEAEDEDDAVPAGPVPAVSPEIEAVPELPPPGEERPASRDDAAGLEVLRRAERALEGTPIDAAVCWREYSGGGFDLLGEVTGFEELVVVDSWYSEATVPGRVRVLPPDRLGGGAVPENPHLLGLPQVLAWAAKAGFEVPRLRAALVVEVGEECMEFGEGLSARVRAAIPEAAKELAEVIRKIVLELQEQASNRIGVGHE